MSACASQRQGGPDQGDFEDDLQSWVCDQGDPRTIEKLHICAKKSSSVAGSSRGEVWNLRKANTDGFPQRSEPTPNRQLAIKAAAWSV